MTIAETTELKMNSTGVSNTIDGILNPLNNRDPQQLEQQISNSSTEANPLLESNRADHSSMKIDTSVTKSKKVDKEEDWASMNTSRRDPEVNDCNAIPPDGGLRAWMIMIGSFVINGVLFSVINTYSLIYLELQKRLLESGETAASSKAGKSRVLYSFVFF